MVGGAPGLAGHPVVGASWEGFVVENLLAAAPGRTEASFYRSAGGAEIDLVLDLPKDGRWAIEIKRALAARPEKGFHQACEDIKPDRRFLAYSGSTANLRAAGGGPLLGCPATSIRGYTWA